MFYELIHSEQRCFWTTRTFHICRSTGAYMVKSRKKRKRKTHIQCSPHLGSRENFENQLRWVDFFSTNIKTLRGRFIQWHHQKPFEFTDNTIKIINILVNFTITFSYPPTLDKLNGWDSHLDGWVILVNEVVLDKLDGESALAHTSCPDHHKFVLRHAWGESGGRDFIPHLSHIRAEMNK